MMCCVTGSECVLEMEICVAVWGGRLLNKLDHLEIHPCHESCGCCKSTWIPTPCVDSFVLCTGKAPQGEVLMFPLKKQQNLQLQKMGHKRPLGMGFVFEESRAMLILHPAAQLCHKWVKLVQGFSVVQALCNSFVLRKKSLTHLLGLSHPAVTEIAIMCEGWAPFLLKWRLLPIDR